MKKDSNHLSVEKEIAQQMVDAYAKEASESASYSKAVWFPSEQIINLAKTLTDGKHDGLRIYFGQYTPDSLDGLPKDYLGRNTVLLVPTLSADATGYGNAEAHEDDLTDIENKGTLCPDSCEGTGL